MNELEQHRIEKLRYGFAVSRRDLFKLLGAGLVVGCYAPTVLGQESGRRISERDNPTDLASWLHISGDGKVAVFTGKVELGQNIRTSLAQQVAEELRVPLSAIEMVMADTDLTPFDAGTFGSRTTPQMGHQLRTVAASAREALLDLAAQRWNVDRAQLTADNGIISDTHGEQHISYGELTHGQKLVKLIDHDAALTTPAKWHIAGTSAPKVDGAAFVTGVHQYTSDMTRPGMLYGKVLRPSVFNATLGSLNSAAAENLPDVKVVRDGNFVGVAAPEADAAERAVLLLKAEWNAPSQSSPSQSSDKELFEYLKKNLDPDSGGRANHEVGSVDAALSDLKLVLAQSYTVPYIAHAPLEPRAAVAEWNADKLTVWTGTQRPFGVKEELVDAFHLAPDHVRVIVPDTGSAYGGKHSGDAAVEAARLARATGKPVKITWTREEEFTWAYFRPAGVIDIKSGVRDDGTLMTWECHNYNSGPAGLDTPYNVANRRTAFHASQSPLRQGSYRALAATANHFARETHMDELAETVKMDPLQFRMKNLTDERLRAVFETAATRFGWGKQHPARNHGFGIAGGFEKGGYVATCAEVVVDPTSGEVRIVRVVEAFDCGPIINPNGLRNQISGAVVQAIGGALFEAIHFEHGRIANPHFYSYRVPRFRDVPAIEVELIDRKDVPSTGAGETPIVGLAPAVGNAIFNAIGTRLRSLPLLLKPQRKTSDSRA